MVAKTAITGDSGEANLGLKDICSPLSHQLQKRKRERKPKNPEKMLKLWHHRRTHEMDLQTSGSMLHKTDSPPFLFCLHTSDFHSHCQEGKRMGRGPWTLKWHRPELQPQSFWSLSYELQQWFLWLSKPHQPYLFTKLIFKKGPLHRRIVVRIKFHHAWLQPNTEEALHKSWQSSFAGSEHCQQCFTNEETEFLKG